MVLLFLLIPKKLSCKPDICINFPQLFFFSFCTKTRLYRGVIGNRWVKGSAGISNNITAIIAEIEQLVTPSLYTHSAEVSHDM
jgi:hypothetical protein